MSAQQVAAEFGASAATAAAVTQYFQNQGFVYLGEEPNHLALTFEGTAQQVDSAFATRLEKYKYNGHEGYLPATGLAVPASIQGMVTGVLGLDTLLRPVSMLKAESKLNASSFSALNHTALEMQTAYHVTPLYQNGYDGSGETIAVATWATYDPNDVYDFAKQMGLPKNAFVNGAPYQVVDAGPLAGYVPEQGGSDETSIDVEWSHAFAPGAAQEVAVGDLADVPDFALSLYDVYSALSAGLDGLATPNAITVSWGYPEFFAPPETTQVLDELFASIAAQGITMFAASGDGNVEGWNVMYPASDPYFVAVGGTQVSLNPDGTIAQEKAWGQAPFDQFYTASTGGYSTQFAAPPWALAAQEAYTPSSLISPTAPFLPGMRGVPDVALSAFGYLGRWSGSWWGFLGTSLGSPSWAGIYADMDQMAKAQTEGVGLGDVAPALYAVAGETNSPFHDITQGTNGQFNAEQGWDPVTGLGTPDVAALSQDLVTYLLGSGATEPGPFISAVTPSAADGSNAWLGVADPLVAMSTPGKNGTLTDAIVAGTVSQISGSGFGTVPGNVYLENNDGSIDIELPLAAGESGPLWGPNAITLDTTGAIAAPPGVYALVVDVPGQAQPLVTGVALESGLMLGNLNPLGEAESVSVPLSVDNFWTVDNAVYANGIVSALIDVLGLSDMPAQMPAALYIPMLATPTQPQGDESQSYGFGTADDLLVTLTSPNAELLGVQCNPAMANPLPLYGLDPNGYPQYLVPAGQPIAVLDPVAEAVDMVVQDYSSPYLVAPAQAEMIFQPGNPVATNAYQTGEGQAGTSDPSQAVQVQLVLDDLNSNPIPTDPQGWQVYLESDTSNPTVMGTVYYETFPGGTPTWVQAAPDVEQGVYDIPTVGPTTVAVTDPTVGDAFDLQVMPGPMIAEPIDYPLASGPFAQTMPITVVPQSSLAMLAASPGTPEVGVPQTVNLAVYDQQGSVVSSAADQISVWVAQGNAALYDTHGDPLVPNPDGSYTIALQSGQTSFAYETDSAGPVVLSAYDDAVYLPAATLGQMVQPGPAQSLAVHVFSSASAESGNYGENPRQIVIVRAFDQYGNVASGFTDTVGLQISGGSSLTVTDGSGAPLSATGGLYEQAARNGEAVYLVSSQGTGTLHYHAEDLGAGGAAPADGSGTFLSPYASQLTLSAEGSVIDNSPIWAGVAQAVTIAAQDALGNTVTSSSDTVALSVTGPAGATLTVRDAAGDVLTADQNGAYEAQLRGGEATLYVSSSLAGGISYGAADLSVPTVNGTTLQSTVNAFPVTLDPVPLTITDSSGQPAQSSGGTITLLRGGRYNIQLAFANDDAKMPVTPIVEVIGPDGAIAFLQGVKASVQSGQETIEFAGFSPEATGAYTVKVFTWNNWLQEGGVPIGVPYHLTVQSN